MPSSTLPWVNINPNIFAVSNLSDGISSYRAALLEHKQCTLTLHHEISALYFFTVQQRTLMVIFTTHHYFTNTFHSFICYYFSAKVTKLLLGCVIKFLSKSN
jgi:hypothetical protein